MVRPINEFGGWLRFFYIISWLSLIITGIVAILFLLAIFGARNGLESIECLTYLFDFGIAAFLYFRIIKLIKIKNSDTPNKIIKFMTWILLLTVVFIIPEAWLNYILESGKGLGEIGQAGIRVLVWYGIWSSYFKKSKRVLEYYGKNAGSRISLKV